MTLNYKYLCSVYSLFIPHDLKHAAFHVGLKCILVEMFNSRFDFCLNVPQNNSQSKLKGKLTNSMILCLLTFSIIRQDICLLHSFVFCCEFNIPFAWSVIFELLFCFCYIYPHSCHLVYSFTHALHSVLYSLTLYTTLSYSDAASFFVKHSWILSVSYSLIFGMISEFMNVWRFIFMNLSIKEVSSHLEVSFEIFCFWLFFVCWQCVLNCH